jgi:hypothetical protein
MSGGHYDYKYYQLNYLADDIESDFLNDGKYTDDDYSAPTNFFGDRPQKEFDRLASATDQQKMLILDEVRKLITDLRKCSDRAKELDYLLSGDNSPSTYLEKLNKINFNIV